MIDTFAIRCNVLKLAFSGQLSQHEVEDGAIDDLLKRVNPNREIKQLEAGPYEIPENWAWVKLEDLYEINPKVEAADDTDAAFIPMERISAGFSDSFTFEVQKWSAASKNHTRFADGDVAFAKISPCFENRKSFIATGLPNGIGGGTTELIILRQKEMLPRFTYYVTLDQRFIHEGVASYKGTVGQQRVKSDVIKNYMVAVPPKEEQQRIIEKIESIFSALDTINTLQSQYQENLAALKSKIIDAGIQGKLTEQLLEDGTAEELYQQIQREKLALEKAGKIKKSKPLPPISDEEKPFDIPDNWKWVRFDVISNILGTGMIRAGNEQFNEAEYYYFKMNNIGNFDGKCHFENLVMVNASKEEFDRYKLEEDDFLFNTRNSKELVGKTAVVPPISQPIILNNNILKIHFLGGIVPKYINYYFLSMQGHTRLSSFVTSTTNVAAIYQRQLITFCVPLPPLAEQKRIVAKLEELLPLCEGK